MALLSVIRRWHFREGMPIREIERRTGLSRNTIRKYLPAGAVEPQFKVPERPGKLDLFAEKLSGWLLAQAATHGQAYPDRIVVAAEGRILCEHDRIIERSHHLPGRTVYDWRHYLAVIQRKPGALRNGAPFLEMPDAFRQLQGHLLKRPGGDREMAEILALVLQHDEQAVLCAVELALEAGVPTKTHVLNILHRLSDGKAGTPPKIDAPQALTLRREPKANVERYDALRDRETARAS